MVNTGLGGYRIDSYAAIPLHDLNLLRLAIVWFGGVTVGLQLPKSAEDQFAPGEALDDPRLVAAGRRPRCADRRLR